MHATQLYVMKRWRPSVEQACVVHLLCPWWTVCICDARSHVHSRRRGVPCRDLLIRLREKPRPSEDTQLAVKDHDGSAFEERSVAIFLEEGNVNNGLLSSHWCSASTRTAATKAQRGQRPLGAAIRLGLNTFSIRLLLGCQDRVGHRTHPLQAQYPQAPFRAKDSRYSHIYARGLRHRSLRCDAVHAPGSVDTVARCGEHGICCARAGGAEQARFHKHIA